MDVRTRDRLRSCVPDSEGDSHANLWNNYFIRGLQSGSSAIAGGNANFHVYAMNNWLDANRDGQLNGTEMSFPAYGPMDLRGTPFSYPITTALPPLTALKAVVGVRSARRCGPSRTAKPCGSTTWVRPCHRCGWRGHCSPSRSTAAARSGPGGGVGALILGGAVTMAGGSRLVLELGSTSDRLVVGGTLNCSATIEVTNAPGFGSGTYTLAIHGGSRCGMPVLGAMPERWIMPWPDRSGSSSRRRLLRASRSRSPQGVGWC